MSAARPATKPAGKPVGKRAPKAPSGRRSTVDSRRQQVKQANREAILNSAKQCFLERGYESITIRDVIRGSGLSTGTFYNYFPDKEALLRTLVESHLQPLQTDLHTAREHAQSVEQFFLGAYLAVFQHVRADLDFFRMMFRNEPVVRALYNDSMFGMMMRSLKSDLADAVDRGLMPAVDLELLTAISFGAGYELCRTLSERPSQDPLEAAQFITRLLLCGLNSTPEKTKDKKRRLATTTPVHLIRKGGFAVKGSAR